MLKTTVILSLLLVSGFANETVKLQPTFLRLGRVASGLSFAHLHGTINFQQLRRSHETLIQTLDEHINANLHDPAERQLFEALRPQLVSASQLLDDLDLQFFGAPHRQKRQLFLGLAMALGITSIGSSIFTATEVHRLHSELTDLRTTVNHVAHVVDETANALNNVIHNQKTVATTCKFLLTQLATTDRHLSTLTNVVRLQTMLAAVAAELSSWGRGLECLKTNRLHPSLINGKRMPHLVEGITKKANQAGRRPLHNGAEMLLKAPVSYLATNDGRIVFIAHIALVSDAPMTLFQHIRVPERRENFYLDITAEAQLLAIDDMGQTGQELTHTDIERCQTEDSHDGQLYICPQLNVFSNDIRSTCLGTLFFSQGNVEERCQHTVTQAIKDRILQIGKREVAILSSSNQTATLRCGKNVSYIPISQGITRRQIAPRCELITKDLTFRALVEIDSDESFIRREVSTLEFNFVIKTDAVQINEALKAIQGLKPTEPVATADLRAWIHQSEARSQSTFAQRIVSAASGATGLISLIALATIVFLYVKYRKSSSMRN